MHRAGLENIVRGEPEFHLAGSFGATARWAASALSADVDVLVMDADSVSDVSPEPASEAAIVLLAEVSDGRSISRLMRSGVRAIVPRDSDPDDILAAIYAAYDGLVLLSTPTAEALAAVYGDEPPEVEGESHEEITSREIDVLKMLAKGLVNKEIAARLGISQHTVKFHISSILEKLGAATRTEAVTLGIRRGLIPI